MIKVFEEYNKNEIKTIIDKIANFFNKIKLKDHVVDYYGDKISTNGYGVSIDDGIGVEKNTTFFFFEFSNGEISLGSWAPEDPYSVMGLTMFLLEQLIPITNYVSDFSHTSCITIVLNDKNMDKINFNFDDFELFKDKERFGL